MKDYRVIERAGEREICEVFYEDGKPISWDVATVKCASNEKLEDVLGKMKDALWKAPLSVDDFMES